MRALVLVLVALCVVALHPILVRAGADRGLDIVELRGKRELFVDDFMIESMEGVSRRLHHPEREGIAIAFDRPWEGKFSAYATVIQDGELFRMYYRGLPSASKDAQSFTCYAESRDGINWVKPNLGLFEVHGTLENNVVLAGYDTFSRTFSPFLDTRPGVPEERRFKAIAAHEQKGLGAFVSSDGIHWSRWGDDYVFTKGMFDSHNVAFWSSSEELYVCYFRTWTGKGFEGFRTISRTTSKDFLNWTDPVAMDFCDTPMEQLYTNGTSPYFRAPHIYIALAKRFFPEKAAVSASVAQQLVENPDYAKASSDSVLMSTRGGNRYDRSFMEAFIRPGDTKMDWIARDNTPALGVVRTGERELSLYRMSHYAQPSAHLARYSLRIDGFVSIHASYQGGAFTTKPFTFEGSELELNFESSAAGSILVELLDGDGKAIPGYAEEDCLPLLGNEIDGRVVWKGGSDVSKLSGQSVQMRVVMRDADLYSFRFR